MKRYLIVGDGVAGARAAVKIKEADPTGEVRIFTDEAFPFYYRVRFPEMIAGEINPKDIIIHSTDFYQNKESHSTWKKKSSRETLTRRSGQ